MPVSTAISSVAVIGKTLRPRDCNSHINVKEINNPPYLYINSTNATDRFTVIMVDAGPQGRGPDYLHWMVTNVSINTPNYQHLSPINIIVDYEKPLLMMRSPTLIRFLVFRHDNVLRVPFGELWVTRKRDFSLSLLYSNTSPTLRLCGPVAGIQFLGPRRLGPDRIPSRGPARSCIRPCSTCPAWLRASGSCSCPCPVRLRPCSCPTRLRSRPTRLRSRTTTWCYTQQPSTHIHEFSQEKCGGDFASPSMPSSTCSYDCSILDYLIVLVDLYNAVV
ncbi:uncharacterized protein LOC124373940 [Homalodisca vitripennis]|uniref:uncharacterized protein LOC124373940 n=1 Tax=Homalodisca vitripennis TaxID=197043 RepID=UPI001EE9FAB1|nr:uncharacterized protein LOC124373940 [Homalodisca vitripennis]